MSDLTPTRQDVAREAGVSVVTVHRVLNRRGSVRPQTEKKVLDAAERLNFAVTKVQVLRGDQQNDNGSVHSKKLAFFLLRNDDDFYRGLARSLMAQSKHHPCIETHQVFHFDGRSPADCAQLLLEEGMRVDALALTAVDHPLINDQEIADILNYVRNSWGTGAKEISASEVASMRTVLGAHEKLKTPQG